jgi:hypothetical protein
MAFSTNFDRNVKNVLVKKAPEYEWKLGWSPNQPWKVDVAGCPKKGDRRLVSIEIELKRDGPLGNVVKVWHWARRANNTASPLRAGILQTFLANEIRTQEASNICC